MRQPTKKELQSIRNKVNLDDKPTKKPITLGSIILEDDIEKVLKEIKNELPQIERLLCIYVTDDGEIKYLATTNISVGDAVYLFEKMKLLLMNMTGEETANET